MGENQYQASAQNNNGLLDIQLAKSEAAMTEQNFEDVITLSTGSLDKLMETHILRLLELRATAFEKKGLLSRASEDATRMIQYVPTSPAGYLKTGHILMTHGKPSLAADSYKKGLHSIPESHHQYKQLQNEYAIATARAQKRFDVIEKLPLELVYKILINLDPERAWVCLKVSKRWCNQVSGCGGWWSSVVVKQTGTEIDHAVCDTIPLVKDHIQQLELANLSSDDLNKKYLTYLKYGIFTNIKVLSLKGAFFQIISSEDLAISLWQLRGTLKSLTVSFESGVQLPLLMVLGSCPNITELYYTTTGDISVRNGGTSHRSECKKLLYLDLRYGNTTYSTLCSHLQLCPNLCRLDIQSSSTKPFDDFDASTTFTKYCPKLKMLGLNCIEGLPDVNNYQDIPTEKGIAYLSVHLSGHFNTYLATAYIATQSHSLQRINIIQRRYHDIHYGTLSYDTPETYGNLRALQYIYEIGINSYNNHRHYPPLGACKVLWAR